MDLKAAAARRALDYVQDGMILGLGTGSTTGRFLDLLGERLQAGTLSGIAGVPTSGATAAHARSVGIPLTSLADHARLDLAVDGADEVDPNLNLIKGLGRALLREKIVAVHADRFLIIADESKLVPRLGRGPLPIEIVSFGLEAHLRWLDGLGCCVELWLEESGRPVVTENGNHLALCRFADGIEDPYRLAAELSSRPGIVEHGLFLDMASYVIAAGQYEIRVLKRVP